MISDKQKYVIQPFALYDLNEASMFLEVNIRYTRDQVLSGKLKGRQIGKKVKILGEELLRFVGTPTVSDPTMQPNGKIDSSPAKKK